MKLLYQFSDGSISEIEVEEKFGNLILEERRKEENYERKLRRYHASSIDSLTYEGKEFADNNAPSIIYEKELNDEQNKEMLEEIMNSLTKTEKRRILLRTTGMTFEEIANKENVSIASVYESITKARNKARKIKFKNF